MSKSATLDLQFTDTSGQRMARAREVPYDCTVGEAIDGVLSELKLPRCDASGRPIVYHGLHDREGRHLEDWETVGTTLKDGDWVVLQPNIDAGGRI
ncbi:MAG: hypothetical protein ACPL7K_09830 [Armatimonadota bacterium]